eukprot:7799444-Karenia_brevis.AAC.1
MNDASGAKAQEIIDVPDTVPPACLEIEHRKMPHKMRVRLDESWDASLRRSNAQEQIQMTDKPPWITKRHAQVRPLNSERSRSTPIRRAS